MRVNTAVLSTSIVIIGVRNLERLVFLLTSYPILLLAQLLEFYFYAAHTFFINLTIVLLTKCKKHSICKNSFLRPKAIAAMS